MLSGYLLHSAIATLKEYEVIFTRYFFTSLPTNVIKCFCFSCLLLVMAGFLLIVTF